MMKRKPGDVILVYYQDAPAIYARIEAIEPDVKPGWCQVTLLFLSVPSQVVRWILRESYVDGESFTMGGQAVRLEEVRATPPATAPEGPPAENGEGRKGAARVIPFKKPS
ncbi:hypothetical protein [Desulfatiglans anilini]|uniref:hypothetical protein n=1 Tax=Desulfatiglans anilini TaxID=90728 RepID=UPI00040E8B0A|nr:hypothetical protein [Desulfatiglans anilini]